LSEKLIHYWKRLFLFIMSSEIRDKKRSDGLRPITHFGFYLVGGFFLIMFTTVCALSLFYNGTLPFSLPVFLDPDESYGIFRRRLTEDCYPEKLDPEYNIIWRILGVMYVFISLAIICDEFFVPALEVIAEKLKITPDVAGATLMAAGGSAPELFKNIFATFEETDAGFGTIIGSAVFNVLFVIGMCALFSKECLHLTWWPLARDCIFYTIGLTIVALFIGVFSNNQMELWEAIFLFGMYLLYIYLMYMNQTLHNWIIRTFYSDEALKEPEPGKERCSSVLDKPILKQQFTSMIGHQLSANKTTNFRVPGTFRVGIQYLMLSDDDRYQSWVSARAVLDMAGDVRETFNSLDTNGDKKLDLDELGELLKGIDFPFDEDEVKKLMKKLDKDNDGSVDYEEFASWYIGSEKRIKRDILNLFNKYDSDRNQTLEKSELIALLSETNKMSQEDIDKTVDELFKEKDANEGITKEQFFLWYDASDLFEEHKQEAKLHEEVSRGFRELFKWPQGWFQRFWLIITLPLMILFFFTMPDVRRPGRENWCFFTFLMSIGWIGLFTYFMVDWAIEIGDTIKIPTYIMGMTFLAAGTSIPDLLSSVIVARQGHGDMAVSSSVGSNIFDILVGLPLPWIVFILIKDKNVRILSCGLAVSIIVLIIMLVAVAVSIRFSGWQMSKLLGYTMFFLYFVFLTQDLVRNFSGDPCDTSCD